MRARIARDGEDVDVRGPRAGEPQAFGQREMRKSSVVLDPAEALLFDRRNQAAVPHQRRRHVAVVRVETENKAVGHQENWFCGLTPP